MTRVMESWTFVAGRDIIACARSASSFPKTGDPNPRGHLRTTHVTSPPHESPVVLTSLIAVTSSLSKLMYGIDSQECTVNHFLSAFWIRTSHHGALDIFHRERLQINIGLHITHSIHKSKNLNTTRSHTCITSSPSLQYSPQL